MKIPFNPTQGAIHLPARIVPIRYPEDPSTCQVNLHRDPPRTPSFFQNLRREVCRHDFQPKGYFSNSVRLHVREVLSLEGVPIKGSLGHVTFKAASLVAELCKAAAQTQASEIDIPRVAILRLPDGECYAYGEAKVLHLELRSRLSKCSKCEKEAFTHLYKELEGTKILRYAHPVSIIVLNDLLEGNGFPVSEEDPDLKDLVEAFKAVNPEGIEMDVFRNPGWSWRWDAITSHEPDLPPEVLTHARCSAKEMPSCSTVSA